MPEPPKKSRDQEGLTIVAHWSIGPRTPALDRLWRLILADAIPENRKSKIDQNGYHSEAQERD